MIKFKLQNLFPKCTHIDVIIKRPRGTFGKIQEEFEELYDADRQYNKFHCMLESADLINATYSYMWHRHRIPFFIIIAISLLTGIYKPIVRYFKRKNNV